LAQLLKKPSKKIDAKAILTDIKAGMSDSALMGKYKLTAGGLDSLLTKPHESGLIQRVSATDIVQDLKAYIVRIQ
jgi:hypothetical protein